MRGGLKSHRSLRGEDDFLKSNEQTLLDEEDGYVELTQTALLHVELESEQVGDRVQIVDYKHCVIRIQDREQLLESIILHAGI